MKRMVWGAGLCLLAIAASSHAEQVTVSQRVALPDGKPAVGAKVLVRALKESDGSLNDERRVVTDETGTFSTSIDLATKNHALDPIRVTSYVMVDMPGMALAFEDFSGPMDSKKSDVLQLTSGAAITGFVRTSKKEPVANARVEPVSFDTQWVPWRLNNAGAKIETPELRTVTDAAGHFVLRPMSIYGRSSHSVTATNVMASAMVNGSKWIGVGELNAREGMDATGKPWPESAIMLYPTATYRGKVVSAITGGAVQGAEVRVVGSPGAVIETLAPAMTQKDGGWEIKDVPWAFTLFITVSHPDYGQAYTAMGSERRQIDATLPEKAVFDAPEVRLRPWTAVRGHIIEEETGKPPSAVELKFVHLGTTYEEGYNDGDIGVGRAGASAEISPDGAFTLKTASGRNEVRVTSTLYLGVERPLDLDAPPAGLHDMVVQVRKSPAYYIRFATTDGSVLKGTSVSMRNVGDTGEGSTTNGEINSGWIWPGGKWGDKMEIRLRKTAFNTQQELLPWTEITTDPQKWPLVISIDPDPKLNPVGTTLDAVTGKPVAGAKVALVANPIESVKAFDPVTTTADGKWRFSGLPRLQGTYALISADGYASERVALAGPDALTTRLAPLVPFSGRILDKATGAPLTLPPGQKIALRYRTMTNWYETGKGNEEDQTTIPINADGTFAGKTLPGANAISTNVAYVKLDIVPEPVNKYWIPLSVPIEGYRDFVIKGTRSPSIVFRVICDSPEFFKDARLDVRYEGEAKASEVPGVRGSNFGVFPIKDWGVKFSYRLYVWGQELVPWTETTVTPDTCLRTVTVEKKSP